MEYLLVDADPLAGMNHYRIRAMSQRGSGIYSKTVTVNMNAVADIGVYPNPVTGGTLQLNVSGIEQGRYFVHIYSATGQLVTSKAISYAGASKITMDISQLAAGVYQVSLLNAEGTSVAEQTG